MINQIIVKYHCLWVSLIIGSFIACHSAANKQGEQRSDKQQIENKAQIRNVKTFGAIGNGLIDDTKSIQAAINSAAKGDTVLIPSGIYKVKTLILKSGINIKSVGLIRQYLPADTQQYSRLIQNSSAPVFFGRNIHQVWLSFHAETMNEAVYISNSSQITITNSRLKGNPQKIRSFPGLLFYNCKEIAISNSIISHYGSPRISVKNYQPGTAIRFLSCQHIQIERNHLHHNGENGIFMHASGHVSIKRNLITHNGMSGIQIGFGKTKSEQHFIISYNKICHNAADAIDINNKITAEPLAINCRIAYNKSDHNGFVKGAATVDGSGIATLVNVSKVHIFHNTSTHSNRPALYLEKCGDIYAEQNDTDSKIELVGKFNHLKFVNNTFDALTVLANTKGKNLLLQKNQMRTLLLPNGISIDSLTLKQNVLKNASLNLNMKGHLLCSENTIRSNTPNGALLLVNVKSALIQKNNIYNRASYGIVVRKKAQQVCLIENKIEALNSCIYDEGAKNLTITENTLLALLGGDTQRTLVSKNPNALRLNRNEHCGGKSDNSIRLEGEGTAFIGKEKINSGYPDYGKVIVKKL